MGEESKHFAVSTSGLTKYFQSTRALDNLNLKVPRGVVFGLLGPNGSGKTTFFKLLMGVLRPTAGGGSCVGKEISVNSSAIREKTVYMGEELHLYNYMTVSDFVQLCSGLYPHWNQNLLERYRQEFNIPYTKRIGELSFGMKSQLVLLVSLAPEPELLLLDEPLAGLDPLFRRRFFDAVLVETIAKGKTVIIASHQLNEVERIADHVAFLHRGRLLKECTLNELKAASRSIRIVFQQEPHPSFWQMEGITNLTNRNNDFQFSVTGNFDAIYQQCREIPHYRLEIINMNLEESFINLLQDREKEEFLHEYQSHQSSST